MNYEPPNINQVVLIIISFGWMLEWVNTAFGGNEKSPVTNLKLCTNAIAGIKIHLDFLNTHIKFIWYLQ